MPQTTKDPVVLASEIVLALQTIASREVNPLDSVVITVGSIHGGSAPNIIPEKVTLQVTVRTYKDDVREQVLKAIERIIKGAAVMAGMPAECEPVITKIDSCPVTYNDPELVGRVTGALRVGIGAENVVAKPASMGSEDFGMYGHTAKVPSFMMWLGSVAPDKAAANEKGGAKLPGLHSPHYLPERAGTIRMGVLGMTLASLELLGK